MPRIGGLALSRGTRLTALNSQGSTPGKFRSGERDEGAVAYSSGVRPGRRRDAGAAVAWASATASMRQWQWGQDFLSRKVHGDKEHFCCDMLIFPEPGNHCLWSVVEYQSLGIDK